MRLRALVNGNTEISLQGLVSVEIGPHQMEWIRHLPPHGGGGVKVGDFHIRQDAHGKVCAQIGDISETLSWSDWLDLIAVPA